MDPVARFREYAAVFEDVVESDDFSLLEPFFTESAVYETVAGPPLGGVQEGRDAVFAHMKASLDSFDRRFESRNIEILDGPALRDGTVWFRWRVSYKTPGLAELVVDGEETLHFSGDRIEKLQDTFPPEIGHIMEHWFHHYGDQLPAPRG